DRLIGFVDDWAQNRPEPPPALQVTIDDSSDRVVGALSPLLDQLERQIGWSLGTVGLEWCIDRPGLVLDEARFPLSTKVSRGRLRSLRVDWDRLAHNHGSAVADLVLATAAAQLAETPLQLSAGRSQPLSDVDPDARSASQRAERFAEVHEAWRSTADQAFALCTQGVSWGTDEDPRQLPARWAAAMTHARTTWAGTVDRLAETLMRCLDTPEPGVGPLWQGQALFTSVLRFVDIGALDASELGQAGLDAQDLASRSFALMVQRRRPT
ncbi:MAG: hypothetical protein AAF211_05355, partial [Myxococcota bacterium]